MNGLFYPYHLAVGEIAWGSWSPDFISEFVSISTRTDFPNLVNYNAKILRGRTSYHNENGEILFHKAGDIHTFIEPKNWEGFFVEPYTPNKSRWFRADGSLIVNIMVIDIIRVLGRANYTFNYGNN